MNFHTPENIIKKMELIPFFFSYDMSIRRLNIRNAQYFPEEIFDFADYIEILDVSLGELEKLPDTFGKLHKLHRLFLGENNFREIPPILKQCIHLEMLSMKSCKLESFDEDMLPENISWLVLTDNPRLKQLPDSLGKLQNLRKFSLAGTSIEKLPDSLTQCKNIEFLRISASAYTSLPTILDKLPHLAWYGDAGNPYSQKENYDTPIRKFSEDAIIQGKLISESPSSRVFRGIMRETGEEIVIKQFKKSMTSDGFAQDDIRASISAGKHPNIIQTYGIIDESRVILHSIDESYTKLGLPPSLDSCTRDTFQKDTLYSLNFIIQVLRCISSACAHLHALGISHGDLYAHNILVNDSGDAILGDFGAASLYERDKNILYECFDVRAFGNLIEDLLSQCLKDESIHRREFLINLQSHCQGCTTEKFLKFQEIKDILHGFN